MAIPKEDLKQIGDLIDKRLMIFAKKTLIPAIEGIIKKFREDLKRDIADITTG